MLLEAGGGVGGTWYWNRYPGARFDSESYTYGYLFSQDLFEEWRWEEHFAPQPETERYLNHVVDRFDLRRHIRFDARVSSAEYQESPAAGGSGPVEESTCRPATSSRRPACSRSPTRPTSPGGRTSLAPPTTPGSWPADGGRLHGQAGGRHRDSSSGVQVVPAIADEVDR